VTKIQEYFHTDWSAMTGNDWLGLVLTVIIFVLMVVVYFWALRPKNKDSLESHRTMLMDDDEKNAEKENGRK
jgi:cytochrome c oxidase cbb3-type subunit IV